MIKPDLKRIIDLAGGRKAVADRLGVSVQAIGQWKSVPALRVCVVSEMAGLLPHQIRPDVFPAPTQQKGEAA
ncbi:YdaS family helix-turn-helix protein [Acetobacter orientalis]